jgi:DnaJ-class molecular chaperone
VGLEYVPEGDLYEVLWVRSNAPTHEIEFAHRRLTRIHHPDTGGGDAIAARSTLRETCSSILAKDAAMVW